MTHRLYTKVLWRKLYFSGAYTDITDGIVNVEWVWSTDVAQAKRFITTDAWDLLHLARQAWPKAKIEVERIKDDI